MPKAVIPKENVISQTAGTFRATSKMGWSVHVKGGEIIDNLKIKKHINMNRKFLYGLAVIVIAALAAVNLQVNNSQTGKLSDISLANVEALALETFCPGGTCSYEFPGGGSCYACCPIGKDPSCGLLSCGCSSNF
ncbi:MAG: NVEALA domain-containing protein [Tannerella sp.]|jgi:hypothetical protein|nr:NVEALA domain-containing protein [Tannerella sp.]